MTPNAETPNAGTPNAGTPNAQAPIPTQHLRRTGRRLGALVLMVGAAAGSLTGLGGSAYAAATGQDILAAPAAALTAPPKAGPTRQEDIAAFLKAGYTYADAQQLAALWHSPGVVAAKVCAGAKLLAGKALPFGPGKAVPVRQQNIAAFLKAGYTYADAQQLAALWHSPSVVAAKVRAGAKLLAGLPLPLPKH